MGCKSKSLGGISFYNPFSQYFGESGKTAKIIFENASFGLISFFLLQKEGPQIVQIFSPWKLATGLIKSQFMTFGFSESPFLAHFHF